MKPEVAAEPEVQGRSVAREYLESIAVAVILALFVRTFAVQAFKIPTASMEDNLLIGDHLLVNKLVYSPSFSSFEERLFGKKAIARGHVVVFKYPKEPERDFIKRVIGLPGEKVEVRGKQVLIDDKPLDESYTFFKNESMHASEAEYAARGEDTLSNWGPHEVPPGHLFVMGDNRDNSSDGRVWGFLPIDQVKGRALVIYWSYEATREEYHATGAWQWFKDTLSAFGRTRWGRFFHLIR